MWQDLVFPWFITGIKSERVETSLTMATSSKLPPSTMASTTFSMCSLYCIELISQRVPNRFGSLDMNKSHKVVSHATKAQRSETTFDRWRLLPDCRLRFLFLLFVLVSSVSAVVWKAWKQHHSTVHLSHSQNAIKLIVVNLLGAWKIQNIND